MSDEKKTWVAGRVRESVDGLGRAPTPEQAGRLREAAEAAERREQDPEDERKERR